MRSDAVSAWADDPRETYRHHSTVRDELGCTGLQEAAARPSSEPDTRRASRTRSGPSTRQHGQRTSLGKQGDDPPHGGLQQDRPPAARRPNHLVPLLDPRLVFQSIPVPKASEMTERLIK